MPTTIFTCGCFDSPLWHLGLHAGHRLLLAHVFENAAYRLANVVIAVNNNESVNAIKGYNRPFKTLGTRLDDILWEASDLSRIHNVKFDVAVFNGNVDQFLYRRYWDTKLVSWQNGGTILIMVKGQEYISQSDELPGRSAVDEVLFCPMLPGISTTILAERKR